MNLKKAGILGGLALIVLGGVAFLLLRQSDQNSGSYSVEQVDITPQEYTGAPIATLATDEIMKQLTPEKQEEFRKSLSDIAVIVKNDPANIEAWFQAGAIKKFFNDYDGARDIWNHITKIAPGDWVSYTNLGALYTMHLQDFGKAEQNYRQALKNNKEYEPAYLGLAELLGVFVEQKSGEAVNVLKDGLKVLPNNISLTIALATLYTKQGDTKNAVLYYEKALAIKPGNQAIEAEIKRLKG